MSIFSGWLKNANGDYVAPKTKTELVLNDDGSTLKDSLDAQSNPVVLANKVSTNSVVTIPTIYTRIGIASYVGTSLIGYNEIPRVIAAANDTNVFPANSDGRIWLTRQTDTTYQVTVSNSSAMTVSVYGIK